MVQNIINSKPVVNNRTPSSFLAKRMQRQSYSQMQGSSQIEGTSLLMGARNGNSSTLVQTPLRDQRSETTKSATLVLTNNDMGKSSLKLSRPAKER